jgi:foldase protein PrsA
MTLHIARRLLTASGIGLCLLLAACNGGGGASSDTGDIATVNGTGISRATYEKRLEATPVARQTLTQLIQGQLLDEYTAAHNITVSDAEVSKKLDELKARYPSGQFDMLLKQQGMTMEDVQRIVRQQIALQKAVDVDIKVSDADVKAYLAKNREQFDTAEQVHVRHILVPDLVTAQLVESQLKAGAKFEDEAAKYSKDPSTKDKGGDLGFFGHHQMVPAFENAAFSQQLNVVGPPVKSQFGYHIIEVLEHKMAETATFDNSKDKVRAAMLQQQEATRVPAFLQGLQQKATIKINDPQLQNALSQGTAGPG